MTRALLHQLQQLALAHDRVGQVQARELDLSGLVGHRQVLDEPVVQRPVHLELQGAERVGDALDGVALAVGVVVHGVDVPGVAGAVVGHLADPVEQAGRASSCSDAPCRSWRAGCRRPRRTRRPSCARAGRGSLRPAGRGRGWAGPASVTVPRYCADLAPRSGCRRRPCPRGSGAAPIRRACRSSPRRRTRGPPSRRPASACPP